MKTEDRIAGLLVPQRWAEHGYSRLGGLTTGMIAERLGLAQSTVQKAIRRMADDSKAFSVKEGHDVYWFSKQADPPAAAPVPVTLPPPDFTPQAEVLIPPKPSRADDLPVWVFNPLAGGKFKVKHQRSARSKFVTRCGQRILKHWKAATGEYARLPTCAGCQRAIQAQDTHQHVWVDAGPFFQRCKVKGCNARRNRSISHAAD